jgi:hypothetical protein
MSRHKPGGRRAKGHRARKRGSRRAPAVIPVTARWAARFKRAERERIGNYGN